MNEISRFDLICIGSGPAGERAAVKAASLGHAVALVERDGQPGGAMVNTGTVASKVLRETALICSSFKRRPIPGIEPEIDRSISFNRFLARTTLVQIEEHDRIESDLDHAGVRVIRGEARLDGPGRVLVRDGNGDTIALESERILLAVGSRPNHPDHVDFSHPAIVDSTSILELERMPRSLVVIGGGVIGSEYASIFAEMGVETTVIEPRSTLMRFLDEECRNVLIEEMTRSGIDFRFGTETHAVHTKDSGAEVELGDGTRLAAVVVLWTLGREGNTDRLGLESVSMTPTERGLITVDSSFRTSCPGIWAAGDVIGFPGLASTSMQQAGIAVDDMFDQPNRTTISTLLPMGIYTIPPVASIGPTEAELLEQGRDLVIGRAEYRRNARGRMLGDDKGIVKLVFDRKTSLLLHATIVGEDATELVHLPMMAMASAWTINDFRETCFTYPSLGALFKSAANRAEQRMQTDSKRNPLTRDQAA